MKTDNRNRKTRTLAVTVFILMLTVAAMLSGCSREKMRMKFWKIFRKL